MYATVLYMNNETEMILKQHQATLEQFFIWNIRRTRKFFRILSIIVPGVDVVFFSYIAYVNYSQNPELTQLPLILVSAGVVCAVTGAFALRFIMTKLPKTIQEAQKDPRSKAQFDLSISEKSLSRITESQWQEIVMIVPSQESQPYV